VIPHKKKIELYKEKKKEIDFEKKQDKKLFKKRKNFLIWI
jgi:hypothetical protein